MDASYASQMHPQNQDTQLLTYDLKLTQFKPPLVPNTFSQSSPNPIRTRNHTLISENPTQLG